MCETRLRSPQYVIQKVYGQAEAVLRRLHKAEEVIFWSDVHHLPGLKSGRTEKVHQRARGEMKEMARNIEMKPSRFAYFGFGRSEVWHRDHQPPTRTQQARYLQQCCRRIVHVLGHVPENDRVIAGAFGAQLIEILGPNIEIQHVAGLLGRSCTALGPTRLPSSAPHLVEKPARAAPHIDDPAWPTGQPLNAPDAGPVNYRQGFLQAEPVPLRRSVVTGGIVPVELIRGRLRVGPGQATYCAPHNSEPVPGDRIARTQQVLRRGPALAWAAALIH